MEGKVAVVTGAASGIGAAIARALGEHDAIVAAVDRDEPTLRDTVSKLTADGLAATAVPCDVTSADQVAHAVTTVTDQLGPVEYLVNAAGVLRLGPARELTEANWSTTMAVNATGVFLMSRAVVERMVPRRSGAIVTVASNAATTPRMFMSAYSASKAASMMFTKCLGLEVARHGIRCNVVAPGSTDTPMLRSMWHDEAGPASTIDGDLDAYRVGIPLGKLAQPGDVAEAVVFLLSDRAAQITMHSLTVDGGAALG